MGRLTRLRLRLEPASPTVGRGVLLHSAKVFLLQMPWLGYIPFRPISLGCLIPSFWLGGKKRLSGG